MVDTGLQIFKNLSHLCLVGCLSETGTDVCQPQGSAFLSAGTLGAQVGTGLPGARDSLTRRLLTQCLPPFCAVFFLPAG